MGRRVEDVAGDTLADGRGNVEFGKSAGLGAQRVEQSLLRLVHGQAPLAVEHLDGFGLLPQQEHPVRTIERRFHLGAAVVVVRALCRRAERTAILARTASCLLHHGRLDGIVCADVPQLLFQLVDEKHLAPVAREVHLPGDLVQQKDVDHRVQVGPALEFLILDDYEIVAEIDVGPALEEALVLPTLGVRVEHDRQVPYALVTVDAKFLDGPGLEGVAHAGDREVRAMFAPELEHHGGDGLVLHLLQRMLHRAHLGDARHEHVDVFVDVAHDRERVQADVGIRAELDVGALRFPAELLEAAAQVQHPDLRADRAVGPGQLVHQHRFAAAGGADDGEVVVPEIVVVEVERHDLAATAAEDQRRRARAAPLRNERRHVDRVRHGLARDAAHLAQVLVHPRRQRHGQAREQGLPVHVGVGIELKTPCAPDRVGGLVRRGGLVRVGEDRELVVQTDEAAAGVDGVRRGGPVVELRPHIRHHIRHLAFGVLGGAHVVRGDDGLGGVGVQDVHAQREEEGRAVLQRRLHEVADQRAHLP